MIRTQRTAFPLLGWGFMVDSALLCKDFNWEIEAQFHGNSFEFFANTSEF